MAKKKKTEVISLISSDPTIPRPRLHKLIIKNLRCIGAKPVEIELDDIVVLVGPNNVGKSSILRAYEVAMSQGSKEGRLKLEDFPNGQVDPDVLPEIELQTIVYDNTPGKRWIHTTDNGEMLIRERWIWSEPGDSKRQGFDVNENDWSENVPWGAPNVANSRRPEPHRVDAFDPPEQQANAIITLLAAVLKERVKNLQSSDGEENDYARLLKMIKDIQTKIVKESEEEIQKVQTELTDNFSKVFPGYEIVFDARPEDDLDKTINLFKSEAQLLVGPNDGYFSPIERQGSGARRTLLWTALKIISESNQKKKTTKIQRPHVLLLDEPEICLHPNAVREACNLLYDLPKGENWQVMVTTHSPAFVDVSRDNTTIIRVERTSEGDIKGTTLFRPEKANLNDDDRQRLKLLNIFDPHVAEFFFGGKIIVVEGDTEYTAFKHIIAEKPDLYNDIHIIRARGKATIVSLIKILNHFGSSYSILHDSDTPTIITKTGKERVNSAWTINQNILNAVNLKPHQSNVRLLASLPNFEAAYFEEKVKTEKPYNALMQIRQNTAMFNEIELLLNALIDHSKPLPENCNEWCDLQDLKQEVERRLVLA